MAPASVRDKAPLPISSAGWKRIFSFPQGIPCSASTWAAVMAIVMCASWPQAWMRTAVPSSRRNWRPSMSDRSATTGPALPLSHTPTRPVSLPTCSVTVYPAVRKTSARKAEVLYSWKGGSGRECRYGHTLCTFSSMFMYSRILSAPNPYAVLFFLPAHVGGTFELVTDELRIFRGLVRFLENLQARILQRFLADGDDVHIQGVSRFLDNGVLVRVQAGIQGVGRIVMAAQVTSSRLRGMAAASSSMNWK